MISKSLKWHHRLFKNSTQGSAAMEYLIVSGFALIVSAAAVTWLTGVIKDKMNRVSQKIQAGSQEFDLSMDP